MRRGEEEGEGGEGRGSKGNGEEERARGKKTWNRDIRNGAPFCFCLFPNLVERKKVDRSNI